MSNLTFVSAKNITTWLSVFWPNGYCCTSGGIVKVHVFAGHGDEVIGAEDHGVSDLLSPWGHGGAIIVATPVHRVHGQLTLRGTGHRRSTLWSEKRRHTTQTHTYWHKHATNPFTIPISLNKAYNQYRGIIETFFRLWERHLHRLWWCYGYRNIIQLDKLVVVDHRCWHF